jgi:Flp pilus assembly protein TadG
MKSRSRFMAAIAAVAHSARGAAKRLARSDRGSVTIEFVIVVPLMLLVLLGFTELYLYMRAVSLVEHTAFTLADSIGQMNNVVNDTSDTSNANSLASIYAAATVLSSPNPIQTNGGVIITSICDKAVNCAGQTVSNPGQTKGTPQILWTAKPTTWSKSVTSSLPSGVVPSNFPFWYGDSAVAVEVFYTYVPFAMSSFFWKAAPLSTTIYTRVYVRPRNGQALTLQAAS